jgi:hypothetical protein
LSSTRYANVYGYLHRRQAMPQYVESPLELLDRILDSDMVYWQQIQLTF